MQKFETQNSSYTGLRIAYLGPEIPALSATFIYREILALERQGVSVLSLSVHKPKHAATETEAWELARRTVYIYAAPLLQFLLANLKALFSAPGAYLSALKMVLSDISECGTTRMQSWKMLYQFMRAALAAEHIKKHKSTHLHVHFAHVPTQIAMYAAAIAGISISFTSHANDLFQRGSLLEQKVERSSRAVTISDYNVRWLKEQGIDVTKVSVVRCGINSKEFTPKPHQADAMHKPKLGTLGRRVEKKGFDILLEAACAVSCEGHEFELQIAGRGTLEDELQQQVQELGLQNNVTFVGPLPHDRVADWMKSLDMFVLACKRDSNGDQDGIPVVLMEAMALGVPVVSTTISGIPELIEHHESGLLAMPADVSTLVSCIRENLNFPLRAEERAEKAVKRIRQEFDEEVNVGRLLQIFDPQNVQDKKTVSKY